MQASHAMPAVAERAGSAFLRKEEPAGATVAPAGTGEERKRKRACQSAPSSRPI